MGSCGNAPGAPGVGRWQDEVKRMTDAAVPSLPGSTPRAARDKKVAETCELLVLDYWPCERIPVPGGEGISAGELIASAGRRLLEKLPLFALSALSSLMTILAAYLGGGFGPSSRLPLRFRVENAVYSYVAGDDLDRPRGGVTIELLWNQPQ